MIGEVVLLSILILMFLIMVYMEVRSDKEKRILRETIHDLQNRLMAKDFTEYTMHIRDKKPKVKNHLMDRIKNNYNQRAKEMYGDDENA